MPRTRQALVLMNPASGNGNQDLDAGLDYLRSQGIQLLHKQPENPEQVADLIKRHQGNIDRVIVGGGDGTMNMALGGVLASGLPLGILPLGTANDLARTLGLPQDLQKACEIIAAGSTRKIDIGEVNGHHFFNVAHIGLAVEVARRSNGELKRRLGALAYPYAAWTAFRTRRTFSVSLHCDDDMRSLRAVQVSVGNGRFYGGGIPIAEDAAIDDGRLDLYAIPGSRTGRLLALLPLIRSGSAKRSQDIVTMAGQVVEVRTRRPKTVSVDGEEMTHTPARFRLKRNALEVFVPKQPGRPGVSPGLTPGPGSDSGQ